MPVRWERRQTSRPYAIFIYEFMRLSDAQSPRESGVSNAPLIVALQCSPVPCVKKMFIISKEHKKNRESIMLRGMLQPLGHFLSAFMEIGNLELRWRIADPRGVLSVFGCLLRMRIVSILGLLYILNISSSISFFCSASFNCTLTSFPFCIVYIFVSLKIQIS